MHNNPVGTRVSPTPGAAELGSGRVGGMAWGDEPDAGKPHKMAMPRVGAPPAMLVALVSPAQAV
jgi:hypothetical protein